MMFTEIGSNRCKECGCKIPQCQNLCREHENKLREEKNAT